MKLRRPDLVETVLQLFLAAVLLLFLSDYLQASGATSCSPPASSGCYPWGAEGPTAGVWYYADKEVYLRSELVTLGILAMAMLVPFVAPGTWTGVIGMGAILIVGFSFDRWLTELLS